jgi:hypothetical protein
MRKWTKSGTVPVSHTLVSITNILLVLIHLLKRDLVAGAESVRVDVIRLPKPGLMVISAERNFLVNFLLGNGPTP